MSGGHYQSYSLACDEVYWHDHELDELWRDLTQGKEFSVRGYDGLLQSLDFYECSDTTEEDYRKAVSEFKRKWFRRTPRGRVEFYQRKLQEYADELKKEMGEA